MDPQPSRKYAAMSVRLRAGTGTGRRKVAEREAAGAAWEDWDLVWCQPNGRPADPHVDWEGWKALLKGAGITKDARLHDARHTCGTLLGELHVDMHVIQRILGHAQISTTRI
jgi:site-specific recombinase XerD